MLLLALKIVLAPLLVASGSLAQRRWGQAVGGRIIGLPLTSLPLLFLLVLAQGTRFAAAAADATLAGVSGQAILTWAYARVSRRHGPASTVVAAVGAFAVTAAILDLLSPEPLVSAALATVVTAALLRAWPTPEPAIGGEDPNTTPARKSAPGHRIGLRMVLAAAFALAVSAVASPLGSHLAGLVTALPVLSLVMFALTQRDDGAVAVAEFAHGVQRGSFSVITALLVLSLLLPTGHVLLAFGGAVATSLLTQLVHGRDDHPTAGDAVPLAPVGRQG